MKTFKSILKWGGLALVCLLIVLAIAWSISRAMYPTEEQREAIAEMESLPEYDGENAFPLLWSLGYDVPESELEEVLEDDVRRFSETGFSFQPDEDGTLPGEFDAARDDYPSLAPSSADRRLFCGGQDGDCLETVREDLDKYRELVERNERLLDQVARLQEFDYIRSAFPPRLNAPFPNYQYAGYPRTRHAVEFASGNQTEAVASLCREIQAWRRFSARAEVLIDRSISIAYSSKYNGQLLATMLSEWPVGRPLPEPCDSTLSPPELADVSICSATRGEFKRMASFTRNMYEYNMGWLDRLLAPLMIDREASVGLTAEALAGACDETTRARLMADRLSSDPEPPSVLRFICVSNLYGCVTSSISSPAMTNYERATLDHGARLRVLGTLAWMREKAGDGRSPQALLEQRPDALKSPEREIEFGPDGQTLQVRLYEANYSREGGEIDRWSIPLPPALYREHGG